MKKLLLIILTLNCSLFQQVQCADTETSFANLNVQKLLIAGSIYATYKINNILKKKREENKAVREFNEETLKTFKINADTIIAFDLHYVIAKYNICKMILTSLRGSWLVPCTIFYPKIFPIIFKSIKEGCSTQQIFEYVEKQYPSSELIKKMNSLGIDITAQLKPIQGTINIIAELIKKNYKVVIMSNIEPKLWQRFIEDFPIFKNFDKFLPTPENNYLKKPNPQYFVSAVEKFGLKQDKSRNYNMLFIDDKIEFTTTARNVGIPAYTFTTCADLNNSLTLMRADI